jgi:hypothetical protein
LNEENVNINIKIEKNASPLTQNITNETRDDFLNITNHVNQFSNDANNNNNKSDILSQIPIYYSNPTAQYNNYFGLESLKKKTHSACRTCAKQFIAFRPVEP